MKANFFTVMAVALLAPQFAQALDEETIYSQNFQINNVDEVVKCVKTDPNSRSYGVTLLSVKDASLLAKNMEPNSEAALTSNTYNGLGMTSYRVSCTNLPRITEGDGKLLQTITLTATGYCSVIYRENLHLDVYGEKLYGYNHGELLPPGAGCDLKAIRAKIESSRPGEPVSLYSDKKVGVKVVTTAPNAEGMCEKRVVSVGGKSGHKNEVIVMPLSKIACGN